MPELICEIWHDEDNCSYEAGQVTEEHDRVRRAVNPNSRLVHTYTAASDFEIFEKSNDWHGWSKWKAPEGLEERFFTEAEADEQRRYLAIRSIR